MRNFVAAVALFAGFAGSANAEIIYGVPFRAVGNGSFGGPSGTIAMDFTVNANGYKVDQLGAFTNTSNTISVSLYDLTAGGCGSSPCATGSLVASDSFSGTGHTYDYDFHTLATSVALVFGDTYQIAAFGYGPNDMFYNNGALGGVGPTTIDTLADAISANGSYFSSSTGVVATSLEGPEGAFGAGNLDIILPATCRPGIVLRNCDTNAVPEPITLSIFGAGLLGAAAIRRRRFQGNIRNNRKK